MHHMDQVQNVENTNAPPSALLAIVLLFIILYIQEKLNFTVNVTVKPFQVFLFYKIIVEAVHLLNVLIVTVHARLRENRSNCRGLHYSILGTFSPKLSAARTVSVPL